MAKLTRQESCKEDLNKLVLNAQERLEEIKVAEDGVQRVNEDLKRARDECEAKLRATFAKVHDCNTSLSRIAIGTDQSVRLRGVSDLEKYF